MATEKQNAPLATKAGTALAIVTIVVSLINGVPAFLALKGKEPYVVYEIDKSQMLYPSTSNLEAIRKLLTDNNIPDSFGTILLSNRGDLPAKEVVVTVNVPGTILAETTDPDPSSKPAWLTVSKEFDSAKDKSRIKYILKDVGITRNFKILVSYISEPLGDVSWDVFYDGKPGSRTASLDSIPENARSVSFVPTLWILGSGLMVSLLIFLILRFRSSRFFQRAIQIALVDTSSREWRSYKNEVILELAKERGVSLVSFTDGKPTATEPREFWDGLFELGAVKVAVDIHTDAQFSSGFLRSDWAIDYALRIFVASQHQAEKVHVVALVIDKAWDRRENTTRVKQLLTDLSIVNSGPRFVFLSGDAHTVAGQILRAAEEVNSTTERP